MIIIKHYFVTHLLLRIGDAAERSPISMFRRLSKGEEFLLILGGGSGEEDPPSKLPACPLPPLLPPPAQLVSRIFK